MFPLRLAAGRVRLQECQGSSHLAAPSIKETRGFIENDKARCGEGDLKIAGAGHEAGAWRSTATAGTKARLGTGDAANFACDRRICSAGVNDDTGIIPGTPGEPFSLKIAST
jgi:hypothetical protein